MRYYGFCAQGVGALNPKNGGSKSDHVLIKAVAQAFEWREALENGEVESVSDLARKSGCTYHYVKRISSRRGLWKKPSREGSPMGSISPIFFDLICPFHGNLSGKSSVLPPKNQDNPSKLDLVFEPQRIRLFGAKFKAEGFMNFTLKNVTGYFREITGNYKELSGNSNCSDPINSQLEIRHAYQDIPTEPADGGRVHYAASRPPNSPPMPSA